MTQKKLAKWTPKCRVKNQYGQPRSFLPKGRTSFVIYAVCLGEHPDRVKIGRSVKWKTRRETYANWNFASGNGIACQALFTINEEFIDLPKLENEILARMNSAPIHGYEWFAMDFDKAVQIIEEALLEYGLSYEKEITRNSD